MQAVKWTAEGTGKGVMDTEYSVNRVEMQVAKWTAEGAAKSRIYFQPSTLRRRAYVSCRRYAGISQSAWNHSMNQGGTAGLKANDGSEGDPDSFDSYPSLTDS